MKELSIEEKAKRYDEAIAMAKECITYIPDGAVNKYMLNMFPELKESEDERIRKQIISFLKEFEHDHYRCLDFSSWIAWLEKQGCKDSQVTLPSFTFDDILALQCCMETVKKVQEDKDLYEKLKDLHGRVYDAYQLEKQEKTQQEPTSDHWQDVRERAAIAAMQGLLSAPLIEDINLNSSVKEITDLSVILANALVKKLKGE